MATKAKTARSTALSNKEISKLRDMMKDSVARSATQAGATRGVGIARVATVEADGYVQVVDSDGNIVDISIEKVIKQVKEKLEVVVGSIGDIAQGAARAGKDIAKKASGVPFELDEVTVGLTITVTAGAVFVGVGGDVNLELKFVRERAGAGKTL